MAITGTRAGGILLIASVALAGCQSLDRLDLDLRNTAPGGLDTSGAARAAVAARPEPDANGLITYPNYQVAVARRGDTVESVAARLGQDPEALARFNGLGPKARLDRGAVIALPTRVAPRAPAPDAPRDIASVAGSAIDRAEGQGRGAAPAPTLVVQGGREPVRHRVERGETAFSVARLYGVTPDALARWNGLPADLSVREGQQLVIPLVIGEDGAEAAVAAPGGGSAVPAPPSAATALPEPVEEAVLPASPALEATRTAASEGVAAQPPAAPAPAAPASAIALRLPVEGSVKRPFGGRNEGIDYATRPGAPVRAAADGTVAAITRDTDRVPILILRHANGYLTVYANISNIGVDRGDRVRAGQAVASVGEGDFLHFELRRELEAIDPTPFFR